MTDSPIRISPPVVRNSHRDTVLSLVMTLVIIFLNVQLWLLVQAVEGALQGETSVVFPAMVGSGLCFAGAWRLWRTLQNGT